MFRESLLAGLLIASFVSGLASSAVVQQMATQSVDHPANTSEATESLTSVSLSNTAHLAVFSFQFQQHLTPVNPKPYLPYFLLSRLAEQANLTQLTLQFGYGVAPDHVQDMLPRKGIRLIVDCNLTHQTYAALAGAFGISASGFEKYRIPFTLNSKEMVLHSDPNDYFCSENLHQLIRMLPCWGNSGVLSALNYRNAFQKKYVAAEFVYRRTGSNTVGYSVKLMVEYDPDNPFVSLVQTRLQKCEIYDHSRVVSAKVANELDSVSRIVFGERFIAPSAQLESNGVLAVNRKKVVGKWYGLSSLLVHQLELARQLKSITVYTQLEREFVPQYSSINVSIETGEGLYFQAEQLSQRPECSHMLPNHHIIKITIPTPPVNTPFKLLIPYLKFMKGFEHYEIIDRGGQQLMASLIVTGQSGGVYYSNTATDRLPEPDFSLPFHVITFTMAIVGYFWVSLWRSYRNILDAEYAEAQKQQKQSSKEKPELQQEKLQN